VGVRVCGSILANHFLYHIKWDLLLREFVKYSEYKGNYAKKRVLRINFIVNCKFNDIFL